MGFGGGKERQASFASWYLNFKSPCSKLALVNFILRPLGVGDKSQVVPALYTARHTHAHCHHLRARQPAWPCPGAKGFTKTSETTSPQQDPGGNPHTQKVTDMVMPILETD